MEIQEKIEELKKTKCQVIRYSCCGKVFAACREPECYTSVEFQRDVRKYAKRGCKIEFVNAGEFEFGRCECKKIKKAEQPELFSQLSSQ